MSRTKLITEDNGFYGIGILANTDAKNIGTLWRSAYILGASFIFTIDKKYKKHGSDIARAWTKIPLYHYDTFEDFRANLPYSTMLIGLEMSDNAVAIEQFTHPSRAVYLLGNEQSGLPPKIVEQCHEIVKLPGDYSLNVSVAGSLVMYDRLRQFPLKRSD